MSVSFTTKNSLVLGFTAASLLLIIGCSLYLFSQLVSANRWVEHTMHVMDEANQSLLCLMDCETAYRGFLITNDEQYLEPYEHCYRNVAKHIDHVKNLTADNPRQQVLSEQLFDLAEQKIKFSQNVIAAKRAAGANLLGKDIVSLAPGKEIMDRFRQVVAKVLANENNLLVDRLSAARQLEQIVFVTIAVLAAATLSLLGWLLWKTRQHLKRESDNRLQLEQAFEEALQSRTEAIKANELKSQFVANISHEIRTPISGILGLSELMVKSDMPTDRDMAQHIFKSAQSLLKIINDLLDFSKLEAGQIKLSDTRFRIDKVFDSVFTSALLASARKEIKVEKHIDPLLKKEVIGDENKLHQVLLNLTYNALKFTESGVVSLNASITNHIDRQIFVKFAVTDTGEGIDPATISRLFQPFVQGDGKSTRTHGGTGLGLSISKKLVEIMGGAIGCESEVGKGSTFWFVVPLLEGVEEQQSAPQPGLV